MSVALGGHRYELRPASAHTAREREEVLAAWRDLTDLRNLRSVVRIVLLGVPRRVIREASRGELIDVVRAFERASLTDGLARIADTRRAAVGAGMTDQLRDDLARLKRTEQQLQEVAARQGGR